MSLETELDVATKDLLDAVAAADAQRPDEPSLPFGQWAKKNLFSSIGNGLLTVIFALIALWAYRGILNFVFSEETRWVAVRVNMRNLFTGPYPGVQYNRLWVSLAVGVVLTGLSLGLMKTIGRGFSAKRISMWFMSSGIALSFGILLREPSVLKDEDGLSRYVLPDGTPVARNDDPERLGQLILTDENGASLLASGEKEQLVRESFFDAMVDRGWWWLAAAIALAIGFGIWFGLGEKRRRTTFIPAIPLTFGFLGVFISSVWWYKWGHYGRNDANELVLEPDQFVARTTQVPFTILWFVLVASYLVGRWVMTRDRDDAGGRFSQLDLMFPLALPLAFVMSRLTDYPMWQWVIGLGLTAIALRWLLAQSPSTVRAAVNMSWLLAPFVTFFVILRDPSLDWGYVWRTDVPMALAFMLLGGLVMWTLTRPGIGERGRLVAIALVLFALYNWVVAFFGYGGVTEWDQTWFFLEPVRWLYNNTLFYVVDWLVSGHFLDRISDRIRFTHMLQKARLSFLLLGLVALVAHNFAGDAKQRMRLVWGWMALIGVVHYLATMINTAETVAAPDLFAGGFVVTIYIAIFTMIFSFPLGILLALGRTSSMPLFRVMSTVYIELVRGIPFITILFFFAVFLKNFLPPGMELDGLAAAGLGFSLFSAAYLAENIRGGLQSIRRGQYEASDAVGLTTVQRTGFIVLPQALRVSIPPLVGAAIATFKETSLLSIVGILDFLRVANSSIPGQTEFVGAKKEGLLFICVIYWIGSYAMSKYSQRLEKQLGVGER